MEGLRRRRIWQPYFDPHQIETNFNSALTPTPPPYTPLKRLWCMSVPYINSLAPLQGLGVHHLAQEGTISIPRRTDLFQGGQYLGLEGTVFIPRRTDLFQGGQYSVQEGTVSTTRETTSSPCRYSIHFKEDIFDSRQVQYSSQGGQYPVQGGQYPDRGGIGSKPGR